MKNEHPKCPRCSKNPAIKSQYGHLQCVACRSKDREISAKASVTGQFSTAAQADRIQEGRMKHAADICQPWDMNGRPNSEFVKIYPEQARQYFTQEQLEKL